MSKKWVFEVLVKDDKDAIGLIAYALYKYRKHILATNLRNQGKNENSIQKELTIFHDQTIQNNSIDDYREKAVDYLNQLIEQIESKQKESFNKEKTKLEKKCQDVIKKEKNNLLKNISEYQHVNKSWFKKLGYWLLSGIPSIVSSFLITCFLLGASMLILPENKRQEVLAYSIEKYFALPKKASTVTGSETSH
ncbi:hypothetical protein ABLB69_00190 [Xenorhabdus khoisanae]|uniref:hypothetical protein n=1 Tax=Xenorhabdus khoisanae TaxID=880157 RepID=UPI0032B70D6D